MVEQLGRQQGQKWLSAAFDAGIVNDSLKSPPSRGLKRSFKERKRARTWSNGGSRLSLGDDIVRSALALSGLALANPEDRRDETV